MVGLLVRTESFDRAEWLFMLCNTNRNLFPNGEGDSLPGFGIIGGHHGKTDSWERTTNRSSLDRRIMSCPEINSWLAASEARR